MGRIVIDDLNWERRRYQAWAAYGQSKLANLLFTLELQRRLTAAGSTVRALAAHPGYAATNLQSHTGNPITSMMMAVANRVVAQSDARGALPTLYAATQDLPGGSYVGPDGFQETRGHPTLVGRSAAADDLAVRRCAVDGVRGAHGDDVPGDRPALTRVLRPTAVEWLARREVDHGQVIR